MALPFSGGMYEGPSLSCHVAVCDSHPKPGFQMWLPESSWNRDFDRLFFQPPFLLWSRDIWLSLLVPHSQSPYSNFQLVTLLSFWLCSPLSLKDGWMRLLTAGPGRMSASLLPPNTYRQLLFSTSAFLRLQELLDLVVSSPGSTSH